MKTRTIAFIAIVLIWTFFTIPIASAAPPVRPSADAKLSPDKEAKIRNIEDLADEEAFEKLKGMDIQAFDDLFGKAVVVAFKDKKGKAIELAKKQLTLPPLELTEGKIKSNLDSLNLAKKICQAFPEDAIDDLLRLYRSGGPVTRGNVLRVIGTMEGDSSITNFMVEALNDRSLCEELSDEVLGSPLRVCDIAYNQLAFRYEIFNAPLIGNSINEETRDYYIAELRNRL